MNNIEAVVLLDELTTSFCDICGDEDETENMIATSNEEILCSGCDSKRLIKEQ